jgi:hypothetical protein
MNVAGCGNGKTETPPASTDAFPVAVRLIH